MTCRLEDQDFTPGISRKFSCAVRLKPLWGHSATYPVTKGHSGRGLKVTTTFTYCPLYLVPAIYLHLLSTLPCTCHIPSPTVHFTLYLPYTFTYCPLYSVPAIYLHLVSTLPCTCHIPSITVIRNLNWTYACCYHYCYNFSENYLAVWLRKGAATRLKMSGAVPPLAQILSCRARRQHCERENWAGRRLPQYLNQII